jgi:poly-gamma-glutamate capsule biosynthesis protein CapA/YwtB (metallophosphatase superfamily)
LALFALTACTSTPTQEDPPPAKPVAEPIYQHATIRKNDFRISIAAVGDMMIGTDYPEDHLPDDDGVSFLNAVAPILLSADIAFGNLESVLADGGEPGKTCRNLAACYLFRSPTRYANHYRDAGFDVLSLANNHARDFGEDGRTATMQALDAAGIYHSGREGEFASFKINEMTVAVLAYAVTIDSNMMLDYELAEQTVAAYAVTIDSNMMLDYELAEQTVAAFAESHDIVIVSFHGGAEGVAMMHVPFAEEEYFGEPRGDVALFARCMVDAGADLVVGHGPHVLRGIELYKDRLIAYSLGNFATYYGISVEGIKGIAAILLTTLDGNGRFIEGEIVSTVQIRPDGPSIDDEQRALNLIRGLSIEDFGDPGLTFLPDGRLIPADQSSAETDLKSTPKARNFR